MQKPSRRFSLMMITLLWFMTGAVSVICRAEEPSPEQPGAEAPSVTLKSEVLKKATEEPTDAELTTDGNAPSANADADKPKKKVNDRINKDNSPEAQEKRREEHAVQPPTSPFAVVARDQEYERKKKAPRPRKFLNLTLGVEFDEKLPPIPNYVAFKGDFKKVVQVSIAKEINALRFTPVREGVGTLVIHDAKGRAVAEFRIEVRKNRLDTIMREMQGLLGDVEGVTLKVVNNKVVVDGQVLLPREMNRIYNVVSQYGDQATSIVTLSPLAQKKIAEFIARDINNPEIEVRAINDKFILQGYANNEDEYRRAEIIAKMYVPALVQDKAELEGIVKRPKPANDGIVNLIIVKQQAAQPPPKIIQLVIHYVELQKDYSKSFRFQFMPDMSADNSGIAFSTGGQGGGTSFSGVISNLFPKLNWAKEHGFGRILESTSLIVEDGKKGVLNSFQEVPYISPGNGAGAQSGTAFKKVGIQSAITPIIFGERSDSINLTMEFDVSALVGQSAAGPLTNSNQMQTDIVVRSGQSAAVGGLITNTSSTGFNKLPAAVSQNPIISLYTSRDFSRNQSQFVVFITPIIKSSASSGSEKIKKKFKLEN